MGIPFVSYCKRGRNLDDLVFQEIKDTNKIEKAKKDDLKKLLEKHFGEEWRAIPSLSFFVYILDVSIQDDDVDPQHEQDVDDVCACNNNPEQSELIV
ncbi:hypothetical protein U1Q18_052017 [Sarracenia purpurea var. burkii]